MCAWFLPPSYLIFNSFWIRWTYTIHAQAMEWLPSSHTQAHIQSPHLIIHHRLQSSYLILLSISHLYRERDHRTWQCSPIFANIITIELDPPQLRQLPTYVDNLSFRWGPLWRGSKLQFSMFLANIWITKSGLNCLWKFSSEITLFLHLHKYQDCVNAIMK